ncbi:PAS domain-containing sensor histidine kinase [Mangrovivirga sp. M17]|uniref:histidine kinase n=1 Tax=Mangrovivirga halotolerans TaxID=2993936 RepID=A0ABT3RVD4_9BACT|nr:PAS domain-containing sensor histidine kinase [Mangrovivirga halotolerans]MCX2745491.1 PAS domain-containing sensor histidine kinase [Mangrovivirga halotolerans]
MENLRTRKDRPSSKSYNNFKAIDVKGDIYKQIFKHSPIPTIVHDMEMNIIDINNSALEEFGYKQEELLEKTVFDLHTEEELVHSNEILDRMHKENKLSVETSFKRKDGSVFYAKATPCKFMLGNKPVIHVFIQDITDHILAEKKLAELNDALKSEMKKVEAHSKQVELKNKELEEFAYVAAHDLKAPITNINILKDMINEESFKDEDNKELFDKLKKNITQLHSTVFSLNDVITFKTTLNNDKELIKFDELFEEIKETIEEQIKNSNATITEDFSNCPEIKYPPLHLKSIMQNLLTNAIKYRNPEIPLKVEVQTSENNGRTCLTVKDNGLGFNSEKFGDKMFGLFKRLHTHIEGKGVGMYIVKSILDTHGGKIEVESKPNEGAMFKVYLN